MSDAGTKWFNAYTDKIDSLDHSRAKTVGDKYLCPCCFLPTLSERGGFEICAVCWWEDDGQDDPEADQVWGGPNGTFSLAKARSNFRDHLDMHDLDEDMPTVRKPSDKRRQLVEYLKCIRSGEVSFDQAEFWEFYRRV